MHSGLTGLISWSHHELLIEMQVQEISLNFHCKCEQYIQFATGSFFNFNGTAGEGSSQEFAYCQACQTASRDTEYNCCKRLAEAGTFVPDFLKESPKLSFHVTCL